MYRLTWIGVFAMCMAGPDNGLRLRGDGVQHQTTREISASPADPHILDLLMFGLLGESPVVFIPAQDPQEVETDAEKVQRLFRTGKFDEAASLAQSLADETVSTTAAENWLEIQAKCQFLRGDYAAAKQTTDRGLERLPYSIRLRWLGAEIYRFNDLTAEAEKLLIELNEQWSRNGWRYRTVEDQLVVAAFRFARGDDAKEILRDVLQPLKQRFPNDGRVDAAIGRLALNKGDYALAAKYFEAAVAAIPDDPEGWFGLAEAFAPSDAERTQAAVESALALDSECIPALLLLAEQALHAERYDDSEVLLQRALQVNPHLPRAHAMRAVIAHLNNLPLAEAESRAQALAHWSGNPDVDHWIGLKLSQKYRFAEGSTYQRRALVYDENYLPAKLQLAHDLLRLGQDVEGWQLAEQVFDRDQYNIVAHNLVTLRDRINKFKTLSGDGFIVRMEAREAELYGQQVLELLARAKQVLVTKYQATLEEPIFVEIFPKQQDFAIRTFSMPGGEGFLGVCFGRLITMNSPAALGATRVSWQSVLWHEFCHVVTLQKTANKMPRWLSEGISVWEERAADKSWGQSLNPQFREMLIGSDFVPLSQLSGAFLQPASPMHLQFAYFESSLAVEFLVQKYGQEKLLQVLDELALGQPINRALVNAMAPLEELDREFKVFAQTAAEALAADWSWSKPELDNVSSGQQWRDWNQQNPRNVAGKMAEARAWMSESEWQAAVTVWTELVTAIPQGLNEAWLELATCYRQLELVAEERKTLQQYLERVSDDVEALERGVKLAEADEDWPQMLHLSQRWIAVQPLIATPYRGLFAAAKRLQALPAQQMALEALVELAPVDRASLHYELAQVYREFGRHRDAKRQVLKTLELAPRFQAAHQLLRELQTAESSAKAEEVKQ